MKKIHYPEDVYKRQTLPFIPEKFLYEVIPSVKKQFQIVSGLLKRKDIDVIYVCTDSGREGEYIYLSLIHISCNRRNL